MRSIRWNKGSADMQICSKRQIKWHTAADEFRLMWVRDSWLGINAFLSAPLSTSVMQQLDDRQTFLLPRPVWVNDIDVTHCTSCHSTFGPLRRRVSLTDIHLHKTKFKPVTFAASLQALVCSWMFEAKQWLSCSLSCSGNIFCHVCSSKSVPLPQLGYGSKPVRVCRGCFEVAYLVTYAIDDDHGLSTQVKAICLFV